MSLDNTLKSLREPELYKFKYHEGTIYPTWDETVSKYNWNEIFEHEDPIQYKAELIPSEKVKQVDLTNIWPDFGFIEQIDFESSGYSVPYFHFLNQRLIHLFEYEGDYEELMSEFDVSRPKMRLLLDAKNILDLLFDQLNRELDEIKSINSEIGNIIKVLFHESYLKHDDETETPLNLFPGLRHFMRDSIYGGMSSDDIITDWMPVVLSFTEYMTQPLSETISRAILSKVNEREPHLRTSETLGRKILIIEDFKKDLLIGKQKELSALIVSQFKDPALAAKDFKQQARNSTHDILDIRKVMIETRDYIAKHKLKSLYGKVSEIIRIAKDKYGLDFDDDVIRNWVNFYGETVLPLYKKQRLERKEKKENKSKEIDNS
jgi:hypothetical protein